MILFSLARKLDMELVLDLICLRKLQKVARRIPDSKKVFFNVSPSSFANPMFREFCDRAAKDLVPERVVLEITRKRRIREYTRFREAATYFKNRGYDLAVDDARAGTLSLRTILELEPDYIKTDITVTRDIHNDAAKQRIFRQFHASLQPAADRDHPGGRGNGTGKGLPEQERRPAGPGLSLSVPRLLCLTPPDFSNDADGLVGCQVQLDPLHVERGLGPLRGWDHEDRPVFALHQDLSLGFSFFQHGRKSLSGL